MQTSRSTRAHRLALCLLVLGAVAALAGAAQAKTIHFKSPSGNINCYIFSTPGSSADCIVRTATWPNSPKKPKSCRLDWAPHSVSVSGQKVYLGDCRGDVGPLCFGAGGKCVVLKYGSAVQTGTVRCTSSLAGITCRRTVGPKHGFFVSRERVVLYR